MKWLNKCKAVLKVNRKCVLPGFETATPEEQNKELIKTFRRVFKTEDGKIVLNALLTDLYFFDKAKTDDEKALSEYAKFFIKERLGSYKTFNITNSIIENIEKL